MQIQASCRRASRPEHMLIALFVTAGVRLSGCGPDGVFSVFNPSSRVLFIGNSFTDFIWRRGSGAERTGSDDRGGTSCIG